MINLFCGYDQREAIGFHVFVNSVLDRASKPVSIRPLASMGLPQGSNSFTLSRFLVPSLMGYRGHAIFADASDMLMLADVVKLDALFDPRFAVQTVMHDYKTKNPRKYIGTAMECENRDYDGKNRASLMIVNCDHPLTRGLWNAERVAALHPLEFLQFRGFPAEAIGALPEEWNRLVDEGRPVEGAKLLHWTAGIPAFAHYRDAPGAELWFAALQRMAQVEAVA